MYDAHRVARGERVGDLCRDLASLFDRERAALQPFLQRFAVDVLEHQDDEVAFVFQRMGTRDVRVIDPLERFQLATEAPFTHGVGSFRRVQDLQRDGSIRARVHRSEYRGIGALRDACFDAVVCTQDVA